MKQGKDHIIMQEPTMRDKPIKACLAWSKKAQEERLPERKTQAPLWRVPIVIPATG
jgi:hypothetical protein